MKDSVVQLVEQIRSESPPNPGENHHLVELLKRFEAILNISTDYFTLIDSRYAYVAVNDAYCEAHGRPRERILHRTVAELWGPEVFRTALQPHLQRCLDGEEIHYQASFAFPRTGLRHFDVSLYPYAGHAGTRHAITLTRDITAQQHAEAELRESKDRYRALIETANDVIFILTADGRIAELNPAFEALTGWSRADWLDQSFVPLLHPDDQPIAVARLQAILSGETPRRREYRVRKSDGRYAIGEFTLAPQIKDGRRAGIYGIGRDITEHKNAEADLRLLLHTGRILTEATNLPAAAGTVLTRLCEATHWPIGEIWMPAPDDTLLQFTSAHLPGNPAWIEFQRVSASLAFPLGQDPLASFWSGQAPRWITDLTLGGDFLRPGPGTAAGLGTALIVPLKAADRTLGLMVFFLADSEPHSERWLTLASAVAAELGTVFHRERAEEQLDRFFNRSLDMHCLAGFDGFLKRVNPAWQKTLGYDANELLSRPYLEIVHPDDRAAMQQELAKLKQGQEITAFEMRCPCKDGTVKWTLWNATALPSQQLIIATGRDITARKRTEEAVQQSEEHYRELFHQAYQMQENLRRLSERILDVQEQERARISRDLHDEVGQALTAINVNLAVLKKTLTSTPPGVAERLDDTRKLLEQTMESVHRFARELRPAMLDDLGLLPTLRSYVKDFVERTGIAVRFHAGRAHDIERLCSDRKTVVYRVVQEGLNNIAKHAQAKAVTIAVTYSRQRVHLKIKDNGRGFAVEPPVEQVRKRLGLLGIAERVRLVGGEFAVESKPGRGTTLRISIPFKPN